jgi:hypothetical protein
MSLFQYPAEAFVFKDGVPGRLKLAEDDAKCPRHTANWTSSELFQLLSASFKQVRKKFVILENMNLKSKIGKIQTIIL